MEGHEECAEIEEYCLAGDPGGDDAWDEWDTAFCGAMMAEPEPVDVPGCTDILAKNWDINATSDDGSCEPFVFETEDEVPGFGLLAAVAAIGVALILRRRL